MSMYTEPIKTSHNINRRAVLKDAFKKWITPNFKTGDCFVTLTFKPSIKFDESSRSKDVSRFLIRLNRRIYGKSFDNKVKQLRSCPIFEHNYSHGVHVHMVLERPIANTRFYGDFDKLVIDTWYEMDNAGIKKAQDVRECYDVNSLMGYLSKQVKNGDGCLNYDINNFQLQ